MYDHTLAAIRYLYKNLIGEASGLFSGIGRNRSILRHIGFLFLIFSEEFRSFCDNFIDAVGVLKIPGTYFVSPENFESWARIMATIFPVITSNFGRSAKL